MHFALWILALPFSMIAMTVFLLGGGCGHSQGAQDTSDQADLHRIFGIPDGAELVSWQGYPQVAGFGQREGLSLAATYRLSEDQEAEFVVRSLSGQWRELPIPDSVTACIPFQGLRIPLDAIHGIYTCRTAGDNVLDNASTMPIEDAGYVNDIVVGVFDAETKLLFVEIRSAY